MDNFGMWVYDIERPYLGYRFCLGEIKQYPKITYFINYTQDRKHVVSCSAFHTEASAKRAMIGNLITKVQSRFLRYHHRHKWNLCNEALKKLTRNNVTITH